MRAPRVLSSTKGYGRAESPEPALDRDIPQHIDGRHDHQHEKEADQVHSAPREKVHCATFLPLESPSLPRGRRAVEGCAQEIRGASDAANTAGGCAGGRARGRQRHRRDLMHEPLLSMVAGHRYAEPRSPTRWWAWLAGASSVERQQTRRLPRSTHAGREIVSRAPWATSRARALARLSGDSEQ